MAVAELVMPRTPLEAPHEHDDTELVERCRRGVPGAAEELVGLHSASVYRLGLRLLGDAEEARDLSQEVFLRAFRALGSFRTDASLASWLFRITTNAARNRRRGWARRRRSRTVALDEAGTDGDAPAERLRDTRPGPDDLLRSGRIRARLREALERLPTEFREAVVLRELEELDYRRIAEILGVRVGTVKSRIARGREQVRAALEDLL